MVVAGAGRGVQLSGGIVGARIGGRTWRTGQVAPLDQPVGDAPGRAAGNGGRQPGMECAGAFQAGTVRCTGGGLGAQDEGRAQLGRDGAQPEHGPYALAIHDAAGHNDRQPRETDQQPDQYGRAEPFIGGRVHPGHGIEATPVSTGLDALGDDGVQPGSLDGLCLFQGGGGGHQADARLVQCLYLCRAGQPEMKAHHRGPGFQQHGQHGVVIQKTAVDLVQFGGRCQSRFVEQGGQVLQPGAVGCRVRSGRLVAEQIDAEGAAGQAAGGPDLFPGAVRRAGAQPQVAQGSSIADGGSQGRGGRAGHGRLHDGQGHAEPLQQGMEMASGREAGVRCIGHGVSSWLGVSWFCDPVAGPFFLAGRREGRAFAGPGASWAHSSPRWFWHWLTRRHLTPELQRHVMGWRGFGAVCPEPRRQVPPVLQRRM